MARQKRDRPLTAEEAAFYAGFRTIDPAAPPAPPALPAPPPRARDVPFEQAVQEFLADWEPKRRAHPAGTGAVQVIRYPGSPFLKVTVEGRSASAFIAAQDGENRTLGPYWQGQVFYPDGWHSPAPHARGSVFDDPPARCMDWFGPQRLR